MASQEPTRSRSRGLSIEIHAPSTNQIVEVAGDFIEIHIHPGVGGDGIEPSQVEDLVPTALRAAHAARGDAV